MEAEKDVLTKYLELDYTEDNLQKLRNNEFDSHEIDLPYEIIAANKRASSRTNGGN